MISKRDIGQQQQRDEQPCSSHEADGRLFANNIQQTNNGATTSNYMYNEEREREKQEETTQETNQKQKDSTSTTKAKARKHQKNMTKTKLKTIQENPPIIETSDSEEERR